MQDRFDNFDHQIRELSHDVTPLPSNFEDQVWLEIHRLEEKRAMWELSVLLEGTFFASIHPLRLTASCAVVAVTVSAILGIWIGSNDASSKNRPSMFSMDSSSAGLNLLGR